MLRLLLASCLTLAAATLCAAEKSPPIAELLAIGWDTRPSARTKAEQLFRAASDEHPGDRGLVYAYALVKLQQRQYPEAAKLLDQYLAIEKSDARAWRAKAWVSMLTKNASESLVELDKVSQIVADEKADLKDAERIELIEFTGRMIGFLEGPAEGQVNAATLAAAKRKIGDRLGESQKEIWQAAISVVVDEFQVLATAKDDAQVQVIAAAEKLKREKAVQLDKDKVDIATRKEELKEVVARVEGDAQTEADNYATADAPLADQVSRLLSQAAAAERDLNNTLADIASLRAQAARERDRFLRDQLFIQIDRLELLASRIDADLLAIERSGKTVQAQRATLLAKHNQAQAVNNAKLAAVQKEFSTLEGKLKRGEAELNKLKKPAGSTGKVISLNKQALALTTYEAFPLELEKQRLIDASEK